MTDETFSLTFAPEELLFVARALDATGLSFQDDPFWGWSPEEIDDALQEAQDSLAAHRYIEVQPDGTIAVDAAVAALAGSLAYRDASLLVSRMVDGEPGRTRQIHFASGLIVEQEQRDDGRYRLTAVRDRETTNQRLTKFLDVVDQPAPPADSFQAREIHFSQARQMAADEGEDACATFLEAVGARPRTAHSVAAALTHPVSRSALLAVSWEEREPKGLGKLSLLEGVDGLWVFQACEREGQSYLTVHPCDASEAARRIEDLVSLVIPQT
jgi:hypothetical protein